MSNIINSSHDELANLNVPVQTHTVKLKCSFSVFKKNNIALNSQIRAFKRCVILHYTKKNPLERPRYCAQSKTPLKYKFYLYSVCILSQKMLLLSGWMDSLVYLLMSRGNRAIFCLLFLDFCLFSFHTLPPQSLINILDFPFSPALHGAFESCMLVPNSSPHILCKHVASSALTAA